MVSGPKQMDWMGGGSRRGLESSLLQISRAKLSGCGFYQAFPKFSECSGRAKWPRARFSTIWASQVASSRVFRDFLNFWASRVVSIRELSTFAYVLGEPSAKWPRSIIESSLIWFSLTLMLSRTSTLPAIDSQTLRNAPQS
jgi:hypothetical protein